MLGLKLNHVSKRGHSSHRLRVETGRWDRPPVPYAQRKCQICDIEIEDEFHFMFVCPLYNADRTKLLPRYYRINPSMQKFINLMNETNARLINRVAKFVYKSFKTRTAYFSQHWNSYVYVVISTFAVCVTCWCHCNYVHLFSCTGLWPYKVWNKTYLLTYHR